MLQDARDLTEGQLLEADICIAGGGAAGIAIALELLESGLDVILLESGGLKGEPASQALYAGSVADAQLHSPLDRYRQRHLGGSTTLWGGRCVPFDDIDFEERPYLPGSGWPFTRESLEPHYRRANALCEAGSFAYTATEAFSSPLPPVLPGFTSTDYSTQQLEREGDHGSAPSKRQLHEAESSERSSRTESTAAAMAMQENMTTRVR